MLFKIVKICQELWTTCCICHLEAADVVEVVVEADVVEAVEDADVVTSAARSQLLLFQTQSCLLPFGLTKFLFGQEKLDIKSNFILL